MAGGTRQGADDAGIPDATVARLPLYHRALLGLVEGKLCAESCKECDGLSFRSFPFDERALHSSSGIADMDV